MSSAPPAGSLINIVVAAAGSVEAKGAAGPVDERWLLTEDRSGPVVKHLRAAFDESNLIADMVNTSFKPDVYGFNRLAYVWPKPISDRAPHFVSCVGTLKSKEQNSSYNKDYSLGWAFDPLSSQEAESFQIFLGRLDKRLSAHNDAINDKERTSIPYKVSEKLRLKQVKLIPLPPHTPRT